MATTYHRKGRNPESANKRPLTIILGSSDGRRFPISQPAAVLSETLKNMLEEQQEDAYVLVGSVNVPLQSITITLSHADRKTLPMIIAYLNAHAGAGDDKSDFDGEFISDKDIDVLKSLLTAAKELEIKGLYEIVSKKMARLIDTNSLNWIRRKFGLVDDFTPEEKEEIRRENWWVDWKAEYERV